MLFFDLELLSAWFKSCEELNLEDFKIKRRAYVKCGGFPFKA